jgi:hypothetical protein
MIQKEQGGFGDKATITLNAGAVANETLGIEGHYHVECRDKDGNLKWEESFPNLVNAIGKELMLDTLLKGSSYSVTGPFLGLIGGASPTFGTGSDTMTSHAGWTEFTNYTVGGSAVRGTAVFASATSSGSTPSNVTTSAATAITYTITGGGGTVSGCFLVLGSGASSTQSNTGGTLYSAGAFTTAKITTAGDTVSVTYSTTATS